MRRHFAVLLLPMAAGLRVPVRMQATQPSWLQSGQQASPVPPPQIRSTDTDSLATLGGSKFLSQPAWLSTTAAPKASVMARFYNTASLVWVGAVLDAVRARDPLTAAGFVVASVSARLLAIASTAGRLANPTYQRLTSVFAVFGLAQAAVASVVSPPRAVAHVVASSTFLAGSKSVLADLKETTMLAFVPSLGSFVANLYWLLLVLPALVATLAAPPSASLTALAFLGPGLVLKDAASRGRLNASTFRRLNLAVGIALLPVVRQIALTSPEKAPFLVPIASCAIALALVSGVKSVIAEKSI